VTVEQNFSNTNYINSYNITRSIYTVVLAKGRRSQFSAIERQVNMSLSKFLLFKTVCKLRVRATKQKPYLFPNTHSTPPNRAVAVQIPILIKFNALLSQHLQFPIELGTSFTLRTPLAAEPANEEIGRDDTMAWNVGRERIVPQSGTNCTSTKSESELV
jgi:hypothetical protein